MGRSAILELKELNSKIYLPSKNNGEGTTMLYAMREHFEPELLHLSKFVRKEGVAIDVGANIGIYTVALARLCNKVYAFEPTPESFTVLQRNLEINSLCNVEVFEKAVADNCRVVKLYKHPAGAGSNSLGRCSQHFIEVETVRLDDVTGEAGNIAFIKIDVQGAERLVLEGATETLKRSRPAIMFEVDRNACFEDPLGAWNLLQTLHYKFFVVNRSGKLERISEPVDEKNVIAIC